MTQSVKHKRSALLVNGSPKLPTTSQLEVGEIAINFAEGHETLSTRNNNSGIATFSSDAVLDKKYISSGSVVSAISAVTKTIEDNEYVVAQAFNSQNDRIEALEDAGFLTGYTETDPTVPSWAKASSKPTYTASEVGAVSTATTYFDDAEYDSNTKRINFKKNNTVVDYIDATDFIKDGMVSSVTVSNGNLVISFNTDAGREDIELTLTQIFNPSNYYDKTTADGRFLTSADTENVFIATYGTTTYSEINQARSAKKLIFARDSTNAVYSLQGETFGVGFVFTRIGQYKKNGTTNSARLEYFICNSSSQWTDGYIELSDTAHTHSNYSLTSHTHTAAEVGALPDTTDIPTQASIAGSGFTKNGNVQSDWMELDQTADSYILNSPVFSGTGGYGKFYGIRTSIIDGGGGYKYFFPDEDNLWATGYDENNGMNHIFVTDFVIKNAGIPGGGGGKYSASTTQFGLIKIGNFLSGHNGFVSVATGTNSTTVARGDHSHTGMLTGVTINGAAASVSNGVASANLTVLPTVTSSDNGKVLTVVNGQWSAATPLTVYTGNNAPDNSMGNNGDIYLQTS